MAFRKTKKRAKKDGGFAAGILILTGANLLVKLLGLFYKIPLVALLGDDGMGYFNSAYTIYTFFYTVSTAGLPVALSVLVAEKRAVGHKSSAERLLQRGLGAFSLLGLCGSLALFLFAPFFAGFIGNPGAALCIRAVSPVLLLSCMTSVLRGYFQGCKTMTPTAVSSVVEAVGKLAAGLLLALYALGEGYGKQWAAAYAIFGVVISTAASLLSLAAVKWIRQRNEKSGELCLSTASAGKTRDQNVREEGFLQSLSQILHVAIPATLTSSVMSLTGILDLMTVMRRLQAAGYTAEHANALYGNYTGLAVPMFNLPPVLIAPVAGAIVPYMSACLAKKDRKGAEEYLRKAMRWGLLIGLPASIGMAALAYPILRLLYPDDSAALAAPLLTVLAPACLFLGMLTVMNAALQACGHERLPILSMLTGGGVKVIASYILIGRIGIAGAPWSTLLCYAAACGMNLFFCVKKAGYRGEKISFFAKALFCGLLCGVGAGLAQRFLEPLGSVSVLGSVAAGGGLYLLSLLGTGVLSPKEILSRVRMKNAARATKIRIGN